MTSTQEEFKIRSIKPVHINPSILEGISFYSGILGPNAAVPVVRYPPTYLYPPTISGSTSLPTTLTCFPGVVDASPQAFFTYQWKSGGTPILDADGPSYYFDDTYDTATITCGVDATNPEGSDSAESNSLVLQFVEPIEITEFEIMAITGVTSDKALVNTGMRAAFITGHGSRDALTVYETDLYTVTIPTYIGEIALVNPGAELGNLTGWTQVNGTMVVTNNASKARSGSWYFEPTTSNGLVKYRQDVALPAIHETPVDNNHRMLGLNFWGINDTTAESLKDQVRMSVECYNGSMVLLKTLSYNGADLPIERPSGTNVWEFFYGYPEQIPPTTRTLRVVMEFLSSAGVNDCQIDDISLHIWSTDL